MKQKLLKTLLLLSALVVGLGNVWADDPVTLFHETFGNNTGSARVWSDSYSVKSGVPAVYSGITGYTVSNAKQGKNTTGSTQSGLMQTTADTDAYIIIGPLNVSDYESLSVTYQWKAASTKGTYSTSLYYATSSGGSYTEVSGTGAGATTFVERSYSLPAAAQVSTLYLKIVWNTSNTQGIIDEVDLSGISGGGGGSDPSDPSISLSSISVNVTEEAVSTTSIDVTYNNLTNYDAEVNFYEADGTTSANYDHSWMTAEINASTKNLDYTISANTGAARTAYLRVYALGDEGEAESDLITITQAAKSVAAPEYNLASSGYFLEGTGLTLTSVGNTIYYNLTTDGNEPANPTSTSTEYTGPIALSSGTVKVKAIAYDTYGNASSVTSRTVNGIAPATLPFNWVGGGKSALTALTGVVGVGLGSDYADSHAPYLVKFDTENDYILIFINERPKKVSVGVKMIGGGSTSKIKVQESTNGVDFSNVEELTISGSSGDIVNIETSENFAATTRVVKLLFIKGSNVGVGPISITRETLSVTVGTDSYATFASNVPLDFTDSDIKAYIAEPNGTTGVTFTQVNKIPANTGVLLYKAGGATEEIPVTSASTDYLGNNVFVPGTGAAVASVSGSVHNYILNKVNDVVGFYRANGQTVATNRAYIRIDESIWGHVKEFIALPGFEDDADGIQTLSDSPLKGENIYNLAGQRLSKMQKGINIVNGKKILK